MQNTEFLLQIAKGIGSLVGGQIIAHTKLGTEELFQLTFIVRTCIDLQYICN